MQRPVCGGFIARRIRRGDGHGYIHLTSGQFARWHIYGPVTVGIRCGGIGIPIDGKTDRGIRISRA